MKQVFRKVLSVVLVFGMILTLLPQGSAKAAGSESVWTEVTDIAAAAASDKSIAVTMTKGSTTWALPAAATSSAPAALTGTVGTDGKLTLSGLESDFGWTVTAADTGYTITNEASKYLYLTAANNGVRVGNMPSVGHIWSVTDGYLTASDSNGATRYVGVYNSQDWRCYTSINNNIAGQTLRFWEVESAGTPEETVPTAKLTAEPGEGGTVVIYHPESGMALTATASGAKLLGAAGTVTDGQLGRSSSMAYMTTHVTGGVYTFELDGMFLTSKETGSGVSFTADSTSDLSKWTLEAQEDGTWVIRNVGANYNGNYNQALEYYNGFTTYGLTTVTAAYQFDFYGEAGTAEIPAAVATPTADIPSGEVDAGTVVTFTCATEGAVIYLSTDDGETWTEGSTFTVTEDVMILVKAVKDGQESETEAFEYTIRSEQPVSTLLDEITEAPSDGAKLVIYHPTSSMVLTNTASGSKLAGTEGTVTDGQLELTEGMAYMTAQIDSDSEAYLFELNGLYLTSAETGNGLSFAEDGTSDLAKWTLEPQEDGTWYLMNVGAAYNGNHNQALEYYNGFTTYGVKANNAAYKFSFYGEAAGETPAEEGLVTDLSQLTDGAYVVIYNPASSLAMTSETYRDWYLLSAEATLADGTIAEPAANQVWQVHIAEDGSYSFTQGTYSVAAWLSGNYVELTNNGSYNADTSVAWTLDVCNAETSTFYMRNSSLTTSYGGVFIEVFNKNVNGTQTPVFCGYSTADSNLNENAYGMQFYLVGEAAPQPVTVAAPTATPAAGAVEAGTEVIFSTETEDAIIYYSTDNGETWTEGASFTVTEDVTLLVKAVLDDAESEVVTFVYTILVPEPETVPIATALAGATGETFTVKGVVTLVDGKNIYIQDATGGIDLYFATAPADIELGETLIGTGARAVYRGLPELSGATYQKSSGLTLTAAEKTIGALTTADVCTYVKLTDLEVTEVYDNNGAYANPNITFKDAEGKTIQLYRAVIGKTDGAWDVAVGDTVTLTAAVGINNTTLQLRNTLPSELIIGGEEPVAEGLVTDLSQLTDGAYVVIYNPASSLAMTSETYRDWYLLSAEATLADGTIAEPAANQVWQVHIAEDGSYSFTQGTYSVAAWLSGNYVELTNNGSYNADTSVAWTLDVCNAETSTFYMRNSSLTTSYGGVFIEVFNKNVNSTPTPVFCGYSTADSNLSESAYGMQFYLVPQPEAPQPTGEGLVTDLSQLEDGAKVLIYSPTHGTAVSSKPNGDWYLKANATSLEDGAPVNFTKDLIWTVSREGSDFVFTGEVLNDDGTSRVISVWPSGTYAELTVNPEYNTETVHGWSLSPFNAENHTWYIKSSTLTLTKNNTELPVYIEAYVRNGTEVFSGYAPYQNQLSNTDYALQFYLVDPDEAVEGYDDGEWDGVLNHGDQIVIYNANAEASLGLVKEATYSLTAVPTEISGTEAIPGNGAYAFRVNNYNNQMGRYYAFEVNGKYLATNNDEELFLIDPLEDGKVPENAKWFLSPQSGGYIIYNKEASYGGTPVCIEYFSSVFSGWTYSPKNDLAIYLFNFYKPVDGTKIYDDIVQKPSVIFDCEDSRYVAQDFRVALTLDDLAETVTDIIITYTAGGTTKQVTVYESSSDGKAYAFTIDAEDIDVVPGQTSFAIDVTATNSYGLSYSARKTVQIIDEPFFEDMIPAPNSQTGEELRPYIGVYVRNAGESPEVTMSLTHASDEPVQVPAVLDGEHLVFEPDYDLPLGRTTITVSVTRADGKSKEVSWSFTVGTSDYQPYFGQLHSHTTYSDGSGSLDTALEYIASMPAESNVQFVAFTDHSNYFDTTSAANPADALNDKTLMTPASLALWNEYKGKVAAFNADGSHGTLLALAGFEMTWSGGPGHINTFDSDGLVSRNNAALNNKANDAGMKLYYETLNKGNSISQFNHPGTTFGNFTDFSYWDEETDAHMFLVEVGNGEGQIGAGGYYPSYEEYTLALDKGWHVAPTNNQDNHKGRWGNANDARDVILTDDFSEQGIYDAIRALRLYATEDKNLTLSYTVNGEPMGTIFADGNSPEMLEVEVTFFDPNATDSISKVELIANSGAVAYTWTDPTDLANGLLTAELTPEFSYYYVRVTQADGDLAVTAPVWVGKNISVGITDFTAAQNPTLVNEPVVLTTSLFNNEAEDVTVTSLVYTMDGSKVIGTDTTPHTVPANGTLDVPFTYTPDTAKIQTITVTAVIQSGTLQLTYSKTLDLTVRESETLEVSPISEVRAQTEVGYEFAIEGIVTSNASGYDKDTAFFDCIYVQDETAGICCFPVSGEYKIGDKVHIEGYTDFYQGEPELQVNSIEVIGEGSVEPTEITAAELNDRSAEGKLVTVNGTVESFEVVNGLIQTIMVKDEAGDLARVFIDGYITTNAEVEGCADGVKISATGLASFDDTFNAPDGPFPRIRIRNRADIICRPAVEDDVVVILSGALELEGKLGVYINISAPETAAKAKLVFHGQFEDTVEYELIRDKNHFWNAAKERFELPYSNIAAKEMTCPVTLTVYNEAGEQMDLYHAATGPVEGAAYDYRVVDWANAAIEKSTDAKTIMLAKAILNYGGAAQNYFGFNLDNPANPNGYLAEETAEQEPDSALDRIIPEGAKEALGYASMALNLEGDTELRLYFTQEVSATDGAGTAYQLLKEGKRWYVSIPGIASVDLDKMFTVSVAKDGVVYEFKASALSWCNAALAASTKEPLITLCKALYLYNAAAEAYFNKVD